MATPKVESSWAKLGGGMNTSISPLFAKAGTPRLALNYEPSVSGGLSRVGGFEPFDGQPAPSAAAYQLLDCPAGVNSTYAIVGATLTGATSTATGTIIYVTATQVAVTKVTGTFALETVKVGVNNVGVVTNLTPTVDGFLDNTLTKSAADVYQSLIGQVPGSGQVRGLMIYKDLVYAWRNNVGGTALAIYKSSSSGWVNVPLYYTVSFTLGTGIYADGGTLTQGAVSAVIKRVVLESGAWGSNAAGRMIIAAPTGGTTHFAAGVAAGSGACTLSGVEAALTLSPLSGTQRVRLDKFNFTGLANNKRLYGCDGVNPEFEFDGDIYVPITTGMSPRRASCVRVHKFQLFYSYEGSLQHSATGLPYQWSAVVGAGELGTGDTITNLVSIGGNQSGSALMVLCSNSLFVLYGDNSGNWNLVPLSRISGAQADSAQDIGGVTAFDTPGVVRYPTTQAFGNFLWDRTSLEIDSFVKGKTVQCSVFSTTYGKYRVFFTDGTALSGWPNTSITGVGNMKVDFDWTVLDYGTAMLLAEHDEIAGIGRTFYADANGWVYEADVGRSFAGAQITAGIALCPMSQNSPLVLKTYKALQLEIAASSACSLYTRGDFTDSDTSETEVLAQYGNGLLWDLTNWDQSYWGVPDASRNRVAFGGNGTSAILYITSQSNSELPHTITATTLLYIQRRLIR